MQDKSDAIRAILQIGDALIEAIESFPQGIPSGHLYAHVMGLMSLQDYEAVIGILVKANRVRRKGHLLEAVRRGA